MNKKQTGDYYRNQLIELKSNLEMLEREKIKHGSVSKFVRGINLNIWNKKRQIRNLEEKIDKYLKDGWIV